MRDALLCLLALVGGVACTNNLPPCRVTRAPASVARREFCAQPPWFGAAPGIDPRWHFEAAAPRQGTWRRDGAAPLTVEERTELRGRVEHALRLRHVTLSSSGFVPSGAAEATVARCLELNTGLCELGSADLLALVDSALDTPSLRDRQVCLLFSVSGEFGPRCAPDDQACGPLALPEYGWSSSGRNDAVLAKPGAACSAVRHRATSTSLRGSSAASACRYDGECSLLCDTCVPWTEVNGQVECEESARPSEKQLYCGCVEGTCSLFAP